MSLDGLFRVRHVVASRKYTIAPRCLFISGDSPVIIDSGYSLLPSAKLCGGYVTLSVWPQDNSEKVVEDFWKKFPGWYDARLAPADWMLTAIRFMMPNTDTEFLKGIFLPVQDARQFK